MEKEKLKSLRISWCCMKQRCLNPNAIGYHRYGGRGITICGRWLENFDNFCQDMGERPEGMTLDRINNDGNYESSNCKWSTPKEQANNRRAGENNAQIGIRVSPSIKIKLEELAELDNRTLSNYIKRLFSKEIKKKHNLTKYG